MAPQVVSDQLRKCFDIYTQGAAEMDQRTFVKVIKESGVIQKRGSNGITVNDCDLIFTKLRGNKGPRKINFYEFRSCVDEVLLNFYKFFIRIIT